MVKKYFWFTSFLLLLLCFNTAYASLEDDSNTIFNWAEQQYPQYFSPGGQSTQTWGIWHYRYYPDTNIYVGVNNQHQVHVMGGKFGISPLLVGTVSDFLAIINNDGGYIINPGNGNCIAETTSAPVVGTIMTYESIPIPFDSSLIDNALFEQLSAEQQQTYLDAVQPPKSTTRWTETVLENTGARYKTETELFTEAQVSGDAMKSYTHSISTVFSEIINGISYTIKSESTIENQVDFKPSNASNVQMLTLIPKNSKSNLITTYTPHIFSGPAYESCEEQSWYIASVTINQTGTQIIDGVSSTVDESFESGGDTVVVEAINESLTVPAGTFNTVRIRDISDIDGYWGIHWISIEHNVEVKYEQYSNGKLMSSHHLISLSQ